MSYATIFSRARVGIQAPLVSIEVHLSNGLPSFVIVGLPETSVRESKERVRSAIINSGLAFPNRRITINLAPADLPKEGGRFDLAIAIGLLAASKQIPFNELANKEFYGELSLNGDLRPIVGDIPTALACSDADRICILPTSNAQQTSIISSANLQGAINLLEVVRYIRKTGHLVKPLVKADKGIDRDSDHVDMSDIIGQVAAKRALEIAASGMHNILLMGPPGSGKSMLANRLSSILPELTELESLECAAIKSISEPNSIQNYSRQQPFRSPHHSSTTSAIVGGGAIPKPGEISLAHNGVLFLDEITLFSKRTLDSLRQPIESGTVNISRANRQVSFPCQFQLVAALNTSSTGHHKNGRETNAKILRYLERISGPFVDRMDLQVDVPRTPFLNLDSTNTKKRQQAAIESSQTILRRVLNARSYMLKRSGVPNAVLTQCEIERDCKLKPTDKRFLEATLETLGLSMRSFHKILKVARTIADLEQSTSIKREHLSEALGYRAMDRLLLHLTK